MSTNEDEKWLGRLKKALEAQGGWTSIKSTLDLDLTWKESGVDNAIGGMKFACRVFPDPCGASPQPLMQCPACAWVEFVLFDFSFFLLKSDFDMVFDWQTWNLRHEDTSLSVTDFRALLRQWYDCASWMALPSSIRDSGDHRQRARASCKHCLCVVG